MLGLHQATEFSWLRRGYARYMDNYIGGSVLVFWNEASLVADI